MVFGVGVLVLLLVFVASRALDRSLEELSQDPTETLGAPAYIGVLSTLVVIVWSAALTACVLGWIGTGASPRSPFLWGGALTAALLADDAFRLHESYYPSAGLSEKLVAAVYAVAGVLFVWRCRRFIARHGAALFVLAAALLLSSVLSDQLLEEDAPFLAEEGAKFLGVVGWALFFARAAVRGLADARR